MFMNIIEHYTPDEEEDKNRKIYENIVLPWTVIWSVVVFVLFCTLVSDQEKNYQPTPHPEYNLHIPCSDMLLDESTELQTRLLNQF